MLEIILVWIFCKRVSKIARQHGKQPTNYCILLIVLWIAGEFVGAMVGDIITGSLNIITYIFAVAGAVIGCSIAFRLAGRKSTNELFQAMERKDGL